MYALIERETGWVIGRFLSEADALEHVASTIDGEEEWALVEFGPEPTDNALIATGYDLRARALMPPLRAVRAMSPPSRGVKYLKIGLPATVGLAAAVVVATFGASATGELVTGRPGAQGQTSASSRHLLEVDAS